MKTRNLKLLVGFISPPIMGVFIMVGYDLVLRINKSPIDANYLLDQLQTMPVAIFFAFLLMGLQSAVYALLMEFIITPYVKKTSWFIASSCMLGCCFGLTLLFVLPAEASTQVLFTGASVGIILGYWLNKINKRKQNNA